MDVKSLREAAESLDRDELIDQLITMEKYKEKVFCLDIVVDMLKDELEITKKNMTIYQRERNKLREELAGMNVDEYEEYQNITTSQGASCPGEIQYDIDELEANMDELQEEHDKLDKENDELKKEVIAERKKVIAAEEKYEFQVKTHGAFFVADPTDDESEGEDVD